MSRLRLSLCAPLIVLALAACSSGGETPVETASGATVTAAATASPAETETFDLGLVVGDLDADGYLPEWARASVSGFCDGENRSPVLEWQPGPEGTVEYAVSLVDPSFPGYTHWVLTGIPADTTRLEQAQDGIASVGVTGMSGQGQGTYVGPCNSENEYVYAVYALDTAIDGTEGTSFPIFESFIEGHVLAESSVGVMLREPADA